jgi:WD40 repeat protein
MDRLNAIPKLMELVKNPFLLSLALEALPGVTEGKKDLATIKVTRVELYDTFVQHWYGVNQRRLENIRTLSIDDRTELALLVEEGFVSSGIDYSEKLALAIFDNQEGNPVVQYTHSKDKNTWKVTFFGSQAGVRLLRDSSPLMRAGNQFRFVHRSMLEYFLSLTIFKPIKIDKESDGQAEMVPYESLFLDTNNPVFKRDLLKEPSIIQFLCDRVRLNKDFERQLRGIIDLSKTDTNATIAATKAITILARAGVAFNGADLRGIKVPGADLSNGQFDSAQLQGADLTGVNLSGSWLRQANMSDTLLEGVQFGELPYLEMDDSVYSCAYSPVGKMLGAGLFDGTIYIYDTLTWTRIHRLQGYVGVTMSIVFSPDSQRLISSSRDNTVRLWDTTSGEQLLVMEGHSSYVSSVAISPCGNRIASASDGMTVRLWSIHTGECLFVLEGHENSVRGVKYSPDGRQVVSGSEDETIRFWDAEIGKPGAVLRSNSKVSSLAFSPDGPWVAAGHDKGHIQRWDMISFGPGPVLRGHTGWVSGIDFSKNSQWFASSSHDCTVRLWDVSSGALVTVFSGHSHPATCIAFSPDCLQIASGGDDRKVRLWEMGSSWSSSDLRDRSGSVQQLAYSRDGQTLLSCDDDGIFRQWDTATGTSMPIPHKMSTKEIQTRAYSSDGRQLALAYSDGTVHLWDCQAGRAGPVLEGHPQTGRWLIYSPCCRWIISVDFGKNVRLWDLHEVEPKPLSVDVSILGPGHIGAVVFSSTGDQFAIDDRGKLICLYDTQSRECQSRTELEEYILSMAFSPNGQQIAIGTWNGWIYLWNWQSEEPCVKLEEHEDGVRCIAYSPCGEWIASGSDGRTVGIWRRQLSGEVESWSRVHSICAFFSFVLNVAWNPVEVLAPMEFVTSAYDESIQMWRVSIDEGGNIVVKMVWGQHLGILYTEGLRFANAVGLDPIHQKLLVQRGALNLSGES